MAVNYCSKKFYNIGPWFTHPYLFKNKLYNLDSRLFPLKLTSLVTTWLKRLTPSTGGFTVESRTQLLPWIQSWFPTGSLEATLLPRACMELDISRPGEQISINQMHK
jgi:hypothetical protein